MRYMVRVGLRTDGQDRREMACICWSGQGAGRVGLEVSPIRPDVSEARLTDRTGEKIVKFGQQTNICVNVQLVHDHIVAITVDGVIRVFSISEREMIAQYRLCDLHGADVVVRARLKDVGGGVGGVGIIKCFEGDMEDMVVRHISAVADQSAPHEL